MIFDVCKKENYGVFDLIVLFDEIEVIVMVKVMLNNINEDKWKMLYKMVINEIVVEVVVEWKVGK